METFIGIKYGTEKGHQHVTALCTRGHEGFSIKCMLKRSSNNISPSLYHAWEINLFVRPRVKDRIYFFVLDMIKESQWKAVT